MTTNTNPDIPHRNRDADEQAFWDRVFHDELADTRASEDAEESYADIADLADVAVEVRRKRLAPGSDWEGMAKTYERALEQIRGALGLTDIDEHETVLSEIVRLKRIEKNAYAAPPWQMPSGSTLITDAMLPGKMQLGQQPPQGDEP